jgi:hypothetical protein
MDFLKSVGVFLAIVAAGCLGLTTIVYVTSMSLGYLLR